MSLYQLLNERDKINGELEKSRNYLVADLPRLQKSQKESIEDNTTRSKEVQSQLSTYSLDEVIARASDICTGLREIQQKLKRNWLPAYYRLEDHWNTQRMQEYDQLLNTLDFDQPDNPYEEYGPLMTPETKKTEEIEIFDAVQGGLVSRSIITGGVYVATHPVQRLKRIVKYTSIGTGVIGVSSVLMVVRRLADKQHPIKDFHNLEIGVLMALSIVPFYGVLLGLRYLSGIKNPFDYVSTKIEERVQDITQRMSK